LCRYYLTGGSQEKTKSKAFVLATLVVFDGVTEPPPELALPGVEEFYFHIQAIGLRQLSQLGYSAVKKPSLRIWVPSFDSKQPIVEYVLMGAVVNTLWLSGHFSS